MIGRKMSRVTAFEGPDRTGSSCQAHYTPANLSQLDIGPEDRLRAVEKCRWMRSPRPQPALLYKSRVSFIHKTPNSRWNCREKAVYHRSAHQTPIMTMSGKISCLYPGEVAMSFYPLESTLVPHFSPLPLPSSPLHIKSNFVDFYFSYTSILMIKFRVYLHLLK